MIYYSSVLIALIKDRVNFVEVNTICCGFAPSPGALQGLCLWKLLQVGSRMNHQGPRPALGVSNSQQSGKGDAAP